MAKRSSKQKPATNTATTGSTDEPVDDAASNYTVECLELKLRQARGDKLTKAQEARIRGYDARIAEETIDRFLTAVPKGRYCELAGRQQKVVDEFAERYEVPCGESTIDLYAALSSLHTRVSEFAAAARLNLDADAAELEREKLRQQIGKLDKEQARLKIEIEKHMDQLIARSDVRAGMEWLSAKLRTLGTQIYSRAGQDGLDCLNQFLREFERELEAGGAVHF